MPSVFPPEQQIVLSIIPRVTGTLSVIGDGAIIYRVLTSHQRRKKSYHRLLLGMSCCDLVGSFACALSTWPVPQGYPRVYGARGTQGTCSAQGFLIQALGLPVPLMNVALGVYYVLVIRYHWHESRLRKVVPWMQAAAITTGFLSGIGLLVLDLFNPTNVQCWIAPAISSDCDGHKQSVEGSSCVSNLDAAESAMFLFMVVMWMCIAGAMAAIVVVYLTVREQEQSVARYRYGDDESRKRTRQVAQQAFFYVAVFWVVFLPLTINAIVMATIESAKFGLFGLSVFEQIFIPSQGFLNALVYFRPRKMYKRFRAKHPENCFTKAATSFSSHFRPHCRTSASSNTESSTSTTTGKPPGEVPTSQ